MSYNVLAQSATYYQQDKHKYVSHSGSEPKPNRTKQPKHFQHIEQTVQRFHLIKSEIQRNRPDIVLLQEVDNNFYTYILKHLADYDGYYKALTPTGHLVASNFATAIIWNKSLFKLVEGHTLDNELYYSLNPSITDTGLFSHPNSTPKNATLVRLQEFNVPHETLCVVSIHVSGDSSKKNIATLQKKRLIQFALDRLQQYNDKYKFIGGDLNCPLNDVSCPSLEDGDCCYRWIKDQMMMYGLQQINQTDAITTCDFNYSMKSGNEPATIDTIFFSADTLINRGYKVQKYSCASQSVYKDSRNDTYSDIVGGSDHAWIMTTFIKR